MVHFSYSFCMAMLHSIWQSALLLAAYSIIEKFYFNKITPLQKRNLLFGIVIVQLFFFVFTLVSYFFKIANSFSNNAIGQTLSNIFAEPIIEKITPWVFFCYLIIIIYKGFITAVYWYKFKRNCTLGLQKIDFHFRLFNNQQSFLLGLKRKVTIWQSTNINTPITFGFFKPIILLPVALVNQLSLQQVEAIILHELTHIQANDYIINWCLIAVENIFFFNPFVQQICKKLRLEREKNCDANVIAFKYAPLLYAQALLQAQRVQHHKFPFEIPAATSKNQLLNRIQYFSNAANGKSKPNKSAFTIASIFLTLVVGISIINQLQMNTISKVEETTATNFPITPISKPTIIIKGVEKKVTINTNKIFSSEIKIKQTLQNKIIKEQPITKNNILPKHETEVEPNILTNTNYPIIPVTIKENDGTMQVVIKEQQSGSKDELIKIYTIAYINDEWVIIPELILGATEVQVKDSTQKKEY